MKAHEIWYISRKKRREEYEPEEANDKVGVTENMKSRRKRKEEACNGMNRTQTWRADNGDRQTWWAQPERRKMSLSCMFRKMVKQTMRKAMKNEWRKSKICRRMGDEGLAMKTWRRRAGRRNGETLKVPQGKYDSGIGVRRRLDESEYCEDGEQ